MKATVEFSYGIGTRVTIKDIGLRGTVIAMLFNAQGPQYQVTWFSDSQRRCEWLFEFEVTP